MENKNINGLNKQWKKSLYNVSHEMKFFKKYIYKYKELFSNWVPI